MNVFTQLQQLTAQSSLEKHLSGIELFKLWQKFSKDTTFFRSEDAKKINCVKISSSTGKEKATQNGEPLEGISNIAMNVDIHSASSVDSVRSPQPGRSQEDLLMERI